MRWILFIPIGLALTAVLEGIPIFCYAFASEVEIRFTVLTLLVGCFAATLVLPVAWFWILGVLFSPTLICAVIAPHPKVASVVFGTLFSLFQFLTLARLYEMQNYGVLTYKIIFSTILICGVFLSYSKFDNKNAL